MVYVFTIFSHALSGRDLKENEEGFISNVSITCFFEESKKIPISCFDVSENGDIAICNSCDSFFSIDTCMIHILDKNGIFKYGYIVKCYGTLLIEYDKDILTLFYERGDLKVWLNDDGSVLKASIIDETPDNRDYINKKLNATTRIYNDVKYSLESNAPIYTILSSMYSRISKVSINNNTQSTKTTVYDCDNVLRNKQNKMLLISAIILFIIPIPIIIRHVVYKKRKKQLLNP